MLSFGFISGDVAEIDCFNVEPPKPLGLKLNSSIFQHPFLNNKPPLINNKQKQ
jgi:hypothetical protein